ncbi:hypothetical protein ACN23B_07620 [Anabaena sp. FACHB-709]|uniref:Glycosyltransferase RgtA/B/C/D-like domain-containing protein n=2 Tax=Nostocaceae TaxID=1162 RepID=A0A1Z4KUK7_ANAVA|nr:MULTISPECIES: hypothetical protein [Nostocaceae]BAY72502.1 hypothetical protein NIES23_53270 [Trichormus variabilis NIES-23]HBW29463.1 hypothetical protein [Nostoc sp. UBA8866]MBD2170881.1 hypothetical protein [Anabaena cylindrica FACHB-318]MBD2262666.1 hypothetical protein [Anabaena sp. FACHB-709]MBD2272213.1 hypothetical protein [Nostoc sp. PCC 7120 = FACHB-418]
MNNSIKNLVFQKHNLLFLVPFIIYATWILIISLYGVNIPILDQWLAPGEQIESFFKNQLHIETLYKQHNESRKLIPNLIFIILAGILGQWNVKAEMIIGLIFAVMMSLLIYLLLLLTNKSFYKNILILIFYDFLLLSPSSFSRWVRGITIHRLIPDACLIVNALIFRSKINRNLKVGLYSLFCVISQYSFSGGIVTWAITLIFITFDNQVNLKKKLQSICLFISLFAVSTSFYFSNYTHPYYHTEPSEILKHSWQDIIIYFLAFLGNILGESYELDTFIGVTFLLTFTLLLILNLNPLKKELIVWFALGFYTLALGILNAITRAPMSSPTMSHAVRVDYIIHLVYLPLSIIVVIFYLLEHRNKNNQVLKNFVFYFLGMITAFYISKNYPTKLLNDLQGWQYQYNYAKSCIQLVNFYPKNDCIKLLFPFVEPIYPWNLDLIITRFKNLSELNVLRPGIVKNIKINNQCEWGYIDSIQEEQNNFVKITGWAKIPTRVADAVILAYTNESNDLIVVDILSIGQTRPDISQIYGSKYKNSGWSGNIDFKNKLTNFHKSQIQAYAFDAEQNLFYPLISLR